jgi:hypothetical protein|nr:MAG TPA: hypothetical protein [Caudoviricetes sp.]
MFNEFQPIRTLAEVMAFASYLYFDLSTTFHPDDDFAEYVAQDGKPAFTPIRASRLNERMSECRKVCKAFGVDIYDTMNVAAIYFEAIASGQDVEQARKAAYFASDGSE